MAERIVQKIDQNLDEQSSVHRYQKYVLRRLHLKCMVPHPVGNQPDSRGHKVVHHFLLFIDIQTALLDSRQVQQVFHHGAEPFGIRAYILQHALNRSFIHDAQIVQKKSRTAGNSCKRCAQVVGYAP